MKSKDKRNLLARYIEYLVRDGIDISDLLCRPLSYFDYDKLKIAVAEKEQEYAI